MDPEDSERNHEDWVDLGHDLLVAGGPPRTDVPDGIHSPSSVREGAPAATVHVDTVSVVEKQGQK